MKFIKTEKDLGAPAPLRLFSLEDIGLPQKEMIHFLSSMSVKLEWDDYDVKLAQVRYLMEVEAEKIRKYPAIRTLLMNFLNDYYAERSSLEDLHDIILWMSPEQQQTLEAIKPRRKRTVAEFEMAYTGDINDGNWYIRRTPPEPFQQGVESGDIRSVARIFKEMRRTVTDDQNVVRFIEKMADLARDVHQGPGGDFMRMSLHRMYVEGDVIRPGSNATEGRHQDGADYIVSATVISRYNVIGGESVVSNKSGETEYLRHTLQPGQGIFQADSGSPLWHDVTPIQPDPTTEKKMGFRDILGLDIYILDKETA